MFPHLCAEALWCAGAEFAESTEIAADLVVVLRVPCLAGRQVRIQREIAFFK